MRDLSPSPTTPLGGDWGSGERVFGPPRGTVETDWLVPLVREAHPGVPHEEARAAVARAWAVLRAEAARAGVAPADADDTAVRGLLGMPVPAAAGGSAVQPGAAADGGRRAAGDVEDSAGAVLETALRVVRAASRAYGG